MKNVPLKEQDVLNAFMFLKSCISNFLKREKYEEACEIIEKAAIWGYNYNFQYCDKELDNAIKIIAEKTNLHKPFLPQENRLVFICSRMADNCELVQQYIRAINYSQIPTLLIVSNEKKGFGCSGILEDINNSRNIEYRIVDYSDSYLRIAQQISALISEFRPKYILQHIIPWDVKALLGIPNGYRCVRYNINFNDHSFWLGASLLDKNIEFRPYGDTISLEKRGIDKSNLCRLLYYPICDEEIGFEGFPFEMKDKIIIFSGGSYYKLNGKFLKVLDKLLSLNDKTVALLACGSVKALQHDVNAMEHSSKVYIIGFRKDIFKVFENVDVFIETFPMPGALMTQYAALMGKPILAHNPDEGVGLEDANGFLSDKVDFNLSCSTLNEMYLYAQRLFEDVEFRKKEGERIKKGAQTRDKFERQFVDLIQGNCQLNTYHVNINYEKIKQFYLDFNNSTNNSTLLLIKTFGIRSIVLFPHLIRWIILTYIIIYLKKLKKSLLFFFNYMIKR